MAEYALLRWRQVLDYLNQRGITRWRLRRWVQDHGTPVWLEGVRLVGKRERHYVTAEVAKWAKTVPRRPKQKRGRNGCFLPMKRG